MFSFRFNFGFLKGSAHGALGSGSQKCAFYVQISLLVLSEQKTQENKGINFPSGILQVLVIYVLTSTYIQYLVVSNHLIKT